MMMALQGSPTHRFFLSGQKSRLAKMICGKDRKTVLISRYFFFTDLKPYGCDPRYFTMVAVAGDKVVVDTNLLIKSMGQISENDMVSV